MDNLNIRRFLAMEKRVSALPKPASVQLIDRYGSNSYLILMATLLSLRARDVVSMPIAEELFILAPTPQALLELSRETLEDILRPIGFYRVKAATLHFVFDHIVRAYQGIIPSEEEALLALPGVGRKTANLVRGEVFQIPCICVDTHVHRIANHCGFVTTQHPKDTEKVLMQKFPQEYWIRINRVLVAWGQHVCVSSKRICSCACELKKLNY